MTCFQGRSVPTLFLTHPATSCGYELRQFILFTMLKQRTKIFRLCGATKGWSGQRAINVGIKKAIYVV